jgi:hypothetical protein
MRIRLTRWRTSLSAVLGLAALACGGQSMLDPGESGGSGGTSGSGGTGPKSGIDLSCQNPRPMMNADGTPTGFVRCDGEYIHRTERRDCTSIVPRPDVIADPGDAGITCTTDADCAGPYGYCSLHPPQAMWTIRGTYCQNGCVRDEDCEAGSVCICGDPVGTCVAATCTTDADCGDLLCTSVPGRGPCGDTFNGSFACQTRRDTCRGMADCGESLQYCGGESERTCGLTGYCGRPFLVDGEARLARVVEGERSWRGAQVPNVRGLDAATRIELARHFSQNGLMEHASVAAFARFTLELLSLGAPAELVRASQSALGDEIRHAQTCFGLASAYAGKPLGPGALSSAGALGDASFEAIVLTAMLEACIGESVAAIEAEEAALRAKDPTVRGALFGIAEDEKRHAELGFRFLDWALGRASSDVRARLLARFDRAISDAYSEPPARDATPSAVNKAALFAHGVLTAELRNEARRAALDEIVVPLVRALGERALLAA